MPSPESNNRRIAKNTVILYIRMAVSMAVSLYTSRIVLTQLGAEDFGINNVVAGVVGMFSFLNASMSGATSRFLTFELGKGNFDRLRKTFGSAKTVHWGIALAVLLLAETVGLWFVNHRLVIPEARLFAANVVYQCCALCAVVTVTQVPYTASVFSHERMSVYAWIEISNTALRLIAVLLLPLGGDKLILWGILTLAVTTIVSLAYRIYCRKNFAEARSAFGLDKELAIPMLKFSGWDLYGNLSVVARTQGLNVLLNLFFGPIMNAAAGIATSVQSAVMALSGNLVVAMRPQIVKRYAASEIRSMLKLLSDVERLAFLLISILTVPILLERDFILKLWLGSVPEFTSQICVFVLLFNVCTNQSMIMLSVINATGKMFRPSFINGTLILLSVPLFYAFFKLDFPFWSAFLLNVLMSGTALLLNAWTVHLYVPGFSFKHYVLRTLFPCIFLFGSVVACCSVVLSALPAGFFRLILTTALSTCLLGSLGLFLLFSKDSRKALFERLRSKLWKNR